MVSIWVTVAVAAVAAVLSLVGALGAQLVGSARAYRLAAMEHEQRRAERDRDDRKDTFARFLVVARAFPPPLPTDSATIAAALGSIRDAAALVELDAPLIADKRIPAVLRAAVRLQTLLTTQGPSGSDVDEGRREYRAALQDLRDDLRQALAR